jgi:hypothetical protein
LSGGGHAVPVHVVLDDLPVAQVRYFHACVFGFL